MREKITIIRKQYVPPSRNLNFPIFYKGLNHFLCIYIYSNGKIRMLPFRKKSLLLVNTRARTTFLVAIYTVMER